MSAEQAISKAQAVQKTLVILLFLTVLLWGCRQGYPTDDLVDGEAMTSVEHIGRLNELSEDVVRHVRHEIALVGDCLLRFTSTSQRESGASVDVPLLTLQSSSKVDPKTQAITVTVHKQGDAGATAREVYETRRWYEAVAFQSHLSQLRGLCSESQFLIEPA